MGLIIILIFLQGCTYLNYGISDIPKDCELNSYRQSDGSLKYYYVGNCNSNIRDKVYENNNRQN